jgi:membrane associated rhomboid family serine protease
VSPRPEPTFREPIVNLPGPLVAVILGLLAIHALREFVLSGQADLELVLDLAVIPARLVVGFGLAEAEEVLRRLQGGAGEASAFRLALARYVLAEPGAHSWSLLTHAALHGSWMHVIFNAVWLAVFGTPVTRRCGWPGLALLILVGAVGGALAHVAAQPFDVAPMIGASTAVSGLTGAASRFMFPSERESWHFALDVHDRPLQPLGTLIRNRNAVLFILVWFGTTVLFGAVPGLAGTEGPIAWEAHIGGFLAGLLLFPFIDRGPRRDP